MLCKVLRNVNSVLNMWMDGLFCRSNAQRCWRWAADGARGRGSGISRISKFYKSYRLEKSEEAVASFLYLLSLADLIYVLSLAVI